MLHHTQGIVLRSTDYSESSIIVKVYTSIFGLQTYIVNGVRSTRSKGKAALYQPGNLLDMVVYHKETGDIFRMSEASIKYVYTQAPFQIVKSSLLLFCVELLSRSIRQEEPNAELFSFVHDAFIYLDNSDESLGHFHLVFMVLMTHHLGFAPTVAGGNYFDMREGIFVTHIPLHTQFMEPALTNVLKDVLKTDIQRSHLLSIPAGKRKALLQYLITYYQLHTEGFGQMHSPDILEAVLRDA